MTLAWNETTEALGAQLNRNLWIELNLQVETSYPLMSVVWSRPTSLGAKKALFLTLQWSKEKKIAPSAD